MDVAENEQLKRILGPTDNCPALERLLDAKLTEQEQTHVSQCGHCKTELALYQSFEEAAPRPDEAAAVQWIASRLTNAQATSSVAAASATTASGWRQRWLSLRILAPASLALATLLVCVGIFQINRGAEPVGDIHVSPTDTMRSQTLDVIAPVGELAAVPRTLSWVPVTGAATYLVRLMQVDRTVLWQTSVAATSAALPASVVASIVPHKRLLWDITALDAQGNQLASSGTKDFVLLSR